MMGDYLFSCVQGVFMKIVIVGGGTVGSAICAQLSEEGHDITVIDTELSGVRGLLITGGGKVTAVLGDRAVIVDFSQGE